MPDTAGTRRLDDYVLLGRTGLRVSPFCLGAMTFGDPDRWGADETVSRTIFDRYVEAGGNFIDTANVYMSGQSEEILGGFLADPAVRDRIVLATKFTISTAQGDPNASGNGRKNIHHALDASLKRLRTDYIDLYWMHCWDMLTPVEEVMETMDGLIRSGKVRYFGMSDVPAWYMARAQTYAEFRGLPRIAAMQLEYSLLERGLEWEHAVAGQELGVGICAWGPLSSGMLTGKYRRPQEGEEQAKGRISSDPHYSRKLTERNFQIVDLLREVADEVGRSPSQVALNWVSRQPGITSTIIGATSLAQLEDNMGALDFVLPDAAIERLTKASEGGHPHLYNFFRDPMAGFFRGAKVNR